MFAARLAASKDAMSIDEKPIPSTESVTFTDARQDVTEEDVPARGRPRVEAGEELAVNLGPWTAHLAREKASRGPELVAEVAPNLLPWAIDDVLELVRGEELMRRHALPRPLARVRVPSSVLAPARASAFDDGSCEILRGHDGFL